MVEQSGNEVPRSLPLSSGYAVPSFNLSYLTCTFGANSQVGQCCDHIVAETLDILISVLGSIPVVFSG